MKNFNDFLETLQSSIKEYNAFVNWDKVQDNTDSNDKDTCKLWDELIGKENIEEILKNMLRDHPHAIKIIPSIIGSRKNKVEVLTHNSLSDIKSNIISFDNDEELSEEKIYNIVEFVKKSGLLDKYTSKKIINTKNHIFSVNVGLDSHGRKNRNGSAMESIIEKHIKDICYRNNYEYMAQVTNKKALKKWNVDLKLDKRVDFVVFNKNRFFIIETNFYETTGSKLSTTLEELKNISSKVESNNNKFIWITDGKGWNTPKLISTLKLVFDDINILNIDMVKKNLLENILTENI